MRLLPVVSRELAASARRPGSYWIRTIAALAAFVAMGYAALVSGAGVPASIGNHLFGILSLGAFAYCLLAGIRGTADALSEEKREGTLGLLFLTDLKGYDVVLGKFVSLSIASFYGIFAVVPALALAFMMGGISLQQFLMMAGCLVNTLFFSLAVGIFVSTFCNQERAAMSGALAIIFLSCVLPYASAAAHTYDNLDVWEVMLPGFLLTSPVFAFNTANDAGLARILFEEFLSSLAFLHLAGWLCLVIASACIAERAHEQAPRSKIVSLFLRIRQELAYGKAERRRALRSQLLDRSAFAWLAGRDRLKARYAWAFLGFLGIIWLSARWKAPDVINDWTVALGALWFVHLFFKVWMASEVSARFIEDRRSNALELILTTPLGLHDFARGQRLALLRQFGGPLLAVFILNGMAMYRGSDTFGYAVRTQMPALFFVAGLVHLCADLYTIQWVAMWRSMRLRGTNRTITQTVLLVVILPAIGWMLLWNASWIASINSSGSSPSSLQILWIWTVGCLLWNAFLVRAARRAFLRDFREVATQAFEKERTAPFRIWKRRGAVHPKLETVRSWKAARRIGIAFAIVLAIAWGLAWQRRHRLEREAAARIATLRAANMPINLVQAASLNAVGKGGSARDLLRQAQRLYKVPPSPFLGRTSVSEIDEIDSNLLQRMEKAVAANKAMLDMMEELPSRPATINAENSYQQPLRLDVFMQTLEMKAILEMTRNPDVSAKSVVLLLHLARAAQYESVGGMRGSRHTLQTAVNLMQIAAVQRAFRREHWEAIKSAASEIDSLKAIRLNFITERARGLEVFDWPTETLYGQFGRGVTSMPGWFSVAWALRQAIGQDRVELLQFLDIFDEYLALAEKPFPEASRAPWNPAQRMPTIVGSSFIAPMITPPLGWIMLMSTHCEALRRVIMSVADVEMRLAQSGSLPEALPDSGGMAVDPFDLRPLRYRIKVDGYTVYSVGEDMKDDGGVPTGSSSRNTDVPFFTGAPAKREKRAR